MSGLSIEDQKEQLRAMSGSVPAVVADSTVIIVGANAPVVRHFGSGTLLRVVDKSFVVTAAHVLRSACLSGATVGISGGDSNFIATAGSWILSDGIGDVSGTDPLDIAVYPLGEDQTARMRKRTFLRLTDVSFSTDLSYGYFLISGFPQIWSGECNDMIETMKLRLLQFSTFAYRGNTVALDGYNGKYHLLLDAKPEEILNESGDQIQFRTRTGAWAKLPNDLHGVSGCSVWQIGDLRIPINQWHADRAKLVAIQTGVYPGRALIKATRWIAVSTLLHSAFPELRPAIELYEIQ